MVLKLRLSNKTKQEISNDLVAMGISVNENASLILTEENYNSGELYCKHDSERITVLFEEIVYIESIGKTVYVHTNSAVYTVNKRLYELEKQLPSDMFLRISNSVIIARKSIKRVKPTIGQKFYLTLKNDDKVDVTRTFYYKFKEYYGI